MKSYPITTLDKLVESGVIQLTRGKIISQKDLAATPGNYPVYSSAKDNEGKFGEYGHYMFDEELITWSVDGGGRLFHRPRHKFSVTNVGGILRILDPKVLDYKFLYYVLSLRHSKIQFDWVRKAHPSVIRELYRDIPVPTLTEQRRIVDILSRVDGIVRLRREAEKKAAELIPALFLDMFGDPATNPKGWPASLFGAVGVLDRGRSRNRPRDAKELYGGLYPFIQTGDVANSGGRITGYTATYSEAGLAQSRLWKRGTLCITIAANIAKTGVLEFDACFPDSVVGFLPSEQVRTDYVQAWLGFLQPTLEANAPQAAQKNINLGILRNLPFPLPPLALQEIFELRCSDVFSIQSQQSAATAKAQAAFDALLARCFAPSAAA